MPQDSGNLLVIVRHNLDAARFAVGNINHVRLPQISPDARTPLHTPSAVRHSIESTMHGSCEPAAPVAMASMSCARVRSGPVHTTCESVDRDISRCSVQVSKARLQHVPSDHDPYELHCGVSSLCHTASMHNRNRLDDGPCWRVMRSRCWARATAASKKHENQHHHKLAVCLQLRAGQVCLNNWCCRRGTRCVSSW
eukprot:s638_g6.t1